MYDINAIAVISNIYKSSQKPKTLIISMTAIPYLYGVLGFSRNPAPMLGLRCSPAGVKL